ncbi:hypothetical protein BD779DRAFT_1472233 [Infundibulicybe gibba]|nr:hypothetical protein BD779DRAFT_1472233 [Infundibulicybe gibba]
MSTGKLGAEERAGWVAGEGDTSMLVVDKTGHWEVEAGVLMGVVRGCSGADTTWWGFVTVLACISGARIAGTAPGSVGPARAGRQRWQQGSSGGSSCDSLSAVPAASMGMDFGYIPGAITLPRAVGVQTLNVPALSAHGFAGEATS